MVSNREQPRLTPASHSSAHSLDRWYYKPWRCPVTYTGKSCYVSQWCEQLKRETEQLCTHKCSQRERRCRASQSCSAVCGQSFCVLRIKITGRCFRKYQKKIMKLERDFTIKVQHSVVWSEGYTHGWICLQNNFPATRSFCMSAWIKLAAITAGGWLIDGLSLRA